MSDSPPGEVKRCLDCGGVKPLTAFPPARRRSDGRNSYCRPCMNVRSQASFYKRREATGRPVTPRRVVPEGMRWCPDCETMQSLENFPTNPSGRQGRGRYCKPCHNVRGRENVIKNHGSTRDFHLRRRYGIDSADYDRMAAQQGGLCAGCRKVPPAHVDHDHATGQVRGLLCFNCNQALGNVRDKAGVLLDLAVYLQRHHAKRLRSSRDFHRFGEREVSYLPLHGRVA